MREHMDAPLIETVVLSFDVPAARVDEAVKAMTEMGFKETSASLPWREVLGYNGHNAPGINLIGARHKEGLTQAGLAAKTGVSRRRISQMETGKRGISEREARIFGEILNIDPGLFLNTPA